jgi:hypothetical protein
MALVAILIAVSLGALTGCSKKDAPVAAAPEPLVHNAFTDNIDKGAETMKKAESLADQTNAQMQQQAQQAQSADQP